MGLFAKRPPCPICGGKVKGLLTWKVGGEKVCDDCYGFVDLPDKMVDTMSIEEFKQYMVFRDENDVLRQEFQETQRIDFGWLDTKFLFDMPHRYLCMDKHLKKTIFEGGQIKSFVIREDTKPLFEGGPDGLIRHPSLVPQMARALGPQIAQFHVQRQMFRAMEAQAERQDPEHKYSRPTEPRFDIPEPFGKYYLEIRFEHPYWKEFREDESGPTFSTWDPDVASYLRDYDEQFQKIEHLARALMAVAFPGAPEITVDDYGTGTRAGTKAASAAPVDAVAEIRKYKELLDQGLITEEEFTAKKRQLLGI